MKDSYQVLRSDGEINTSSKNLFSPSDFFSAQCNIFPLHYVKETHTHPNSHTENSHCKAHDENWDPRGRAVTQREQERKGLGVMTALCFNVNRRILALRPRLLVWAEVDKATYPQKPLPVLWQTAGAERSQLCLTARPHPGRAKPQQEGD